MWSAQDEAEYQRLKTASPAPAWSQQDEAEYQRLKQPQAPGMLSQMGQGALKGLIPGVNTVEEFNKPNPDLLDKSLRVGGALGGDLAGMAGNIAAGAASSGGSLAGLFTKAGAQGAGKAALTQGAFGGVGPLVAPVAQWAGDKGAAMGKAFGRIGGLDPDVNYPSDEDYGRNFMKQISQEVGRAAGEMLPSAVMLLLGGKAYNRLSNRPVVTEPALPPSAQALKDYGGQVTPAMGAKNIVSKAALGGAEISARSNPLLFGKYAGIDEANAQAAKAMAQDKFGSNVLDAGARPETGGDIQASLKDMAKKRSADYQPLVKQLKDVPGNPTLVSDFKENALGRIKDLDIAPDHMEAFSKAMDKTLKPGMTPAQVDKAITSLQGQFEKQVGMGQYSPGLQKQIGFDFKNMLRATKEAYYEGLNKAMPGLGDMAQEAKGDYAQASQALNPLSKAVQLVNEKPETVGPKMLAQGSGSVSTLLDWADKNTPQVAGDLRRNFAKAILQETAGSGPALKNALKKYRDILPKLGESGKDLQNLSDAMETARSNQLGVVNPSGTGKVVAAGAHLAGMANPSAWPAMIAKGAVDAGYTYGIPAAQKMAQAVKGVHFPWLKNLQPAVEASRIGAARSGLPAGQ